MNPFISPSPDEYLILDVDQQQAQDDLDREEQRRTSDFCYSDFPDEPPQPSFGFSMSLLSY